MMSSCISFTRRSSKSDVMACQKSLEQLSGAKYGEMTDENIESLFPGKISQETVQIFRNYMDCYTCTIPSWNSALELYSLSRKYKLISLAKTCEKLFTENPVRSSDVPGVISKATEIQINDFTSNQSGPLEYYFFEDSLRVHPNEFIVPLFTSSSVASYPVPQGFRDSFDTDVTNSIDLQVSKGRKTIQGLQLVLQRLPDSDKVVKIYVNASSENEENCFSEAREVLLRDIMVIDFENAIKLWADEAVRLSITTEVKPELCKTISEVEQKDDYITVRLESTLKNSQGNYVFLIDKIFYM